MYPLIARRRRRWLLKSYPMPRPARSDGRKPATLAATPCRLLLFRQPESPILDYEDLLQLPSLSLTMDIRSLSVRLLTHLKHNRRPLVSVVDLSASLLKRL